MKIRMLTALSGTDYSLAPGDEREFGDAEAIRLIKAGIAVPASDGNAETATRPAAPERRGKRQGKADA